MGLWGRLKMVQEGENRPELGIDHGDRRRVRDGDLMADQM